MGAIGFVKRTPCALLLVAQLVGVLLYPFMESSSAGRAAFAIFGILVLALAVIAIRATTLSSTGLSDITPLTGHARSVVMIEQVAGIFYIAMVVTRLVGLQAMRKRA